jgi:hypothetical protein
MSLDPKIAEAIQRAASEAGQEANFAKRLIAWMNDLSNGNESLADNDSVKRHLNLVFEVTKIRELDY